MSAFAKALGSVGQGLLKFGRGAGGAAQFVTAGNKYKKVGSALRKPIRSNPIRTRRNLMTIGLAGQGLGWITLPYLMSKLYEEPPLRTELRPEIQEARRQLHKAKAQANLKRLEFNRRERAIQQEERRLQQVAPHLYNRIAAGRHLPAGAVVIGGVPRRDLLRELSEAMHEGAFNEPSDPKVDISQLLQ